MFGKGSQQTIVLPPEHDPFCRDGIAALQMREEEGASNIVQSIGRPKIAPSVPIDFVPQELPSVRAFLQEEFGAFGEFGHVDEQRPRSRTVSEHPEEEILLQARAQQHTCEFREHY